MEKLLPNNTIYLEKVVKEQYPTVELKSNSSVLNFGKLINVRPICYHCGAYNLSNDATDYFWHRCSSFKHFYCESCFNYSLKKYTHTCEDGEPILDERKTIEELLCEKIKFECQWPDCKKIFCGATLKKHEISCAVQPKRECPVEGCVWLGRIDKMESSHFRTHEDSQLILSNVVINLKSSKKSYLLILGKFVLVHYNGEELGEVFQHNISLQVCKEVLNDAKPVGLVSVNDTLLKKIQGLDSILSIERNVVLFVYFENVRCSSWVESTSQ